MTELVTFLVAGAAAGALYGLVALALAVVHRTTGVVNLAVPALALAGAYAVPAARQDPLDLGFTPAVVVSLTACALGALVLSAVLARVRAPAHFVVAATAGLLLGAVQLASWLGGSARRDLGDPWGTDVQELQGVTVADVDAVRIAAAAALLLAVLLIVQATPAGLRLRAFWSDREAAEAQGIGTRSVHAVAWVVAGVAAGAAGVLLAIGERGADPQLATAALLALPALAIGGMRSPAGAVAGGLAVGVAASLAEGYGDRLPDAIADAHVVAPFALLAIVLLLRPGGVFGPRPKAAA